jgi:hypothetical protein
MVTRVDELTADQAARMQALANRWIVTGLRTGPADRLRCEAAARCCYEHVGVPWHGNVVWVGSPLMVALAGPAAATLLAWESQGQLHEVKTALACKAVSDAAREVIRAALQGSPGRPVACELFYDGHDGNSLSLASLLTGAVEGRVCKAAERAVSAAARSAVSDHVQALQDVVNGVVGTLVRDAVNEPLGAEAHDGVVCDAEEALRSVLPSYGSLVIAGQLGAGGWNHGPAYTSFLREVCTLERDVWALAVAYEQTAQSACWWYPHRDFLIVCEPPQEIHLDDPVRIRARRVHRMGGPAISWPDGWGIHAVHGVRVPRWVAEHPQTITPGKIERERNAEVCRVMLDLYGWGRYMADCRAQVVDQALQDHAIMGLRGARLLRKELPDEPEPIVYLDMVNSTPEPDGTYRRYLERVDPKAYGGDAGRLCHAAMASRWHHRDEQGKLRRTFERWQDYQPQAES